MGWPISDRYLVPEPSSYGSPMHSGNAAAMPPVRKAATFSFCHASRSARITTAILVSNCMSYSGVIPGRVKDANPESRDSGFDASHRPGMTTNKYLPPGVAGPCADYAFLAAEFVAFARRQVERARNPRLDRVTV